MRAAARSGAGTSPRATRKRPAGARTRGARVEDDRIDPRFARVVRALARKPGVTFGGGTGFGSDALKFRGRLFAFLSSKGAFVAKLPADRVSELVRLGRGERFEPARGRVMREWIAVGGRSEEWSGLAREALLFLAGRPPRARKDGGQ